MELYYKYPGAFFFLKVGQHIKSGINQAFRTGTLPFSKNSVKFCESLRTTAEQNVHCNFSRVHRNGQSFFMVNKQLGCHFADQKFSGYFFNRFKFKKLKTPDINN